MSLATKTDISELAGWAVPSRMCLFRNHTWCVSVLVHLWSPSILVMLLIIVISSLCVCVSYVTGALKKPSDGQQKPFNQDQCNHPEAPQRTWKMWHHFCDMRVASNGITQYQAWCLLLNFKAKLVFLGKVVWNNRPIVFFFSFRFWKINRKEGVKN